MFSATYVYDRGTQSETTVTIAERPTGEFAHVVTRDGGCEIVKSEMLDSDAARTIIDRLIERTDYSRGFLVAGQLVSEPLDALPEYA